MKKNLLLVVLLGVATVRDASAQLLTQVPMQGGMVMPMVSYDARSAMFHVMLTNTVPQLTPLLASAPTNWFDPSAPWFDALDPSAQGRSFSRRYGFDMSGSTDALPPNTQMWIRKLSGSPELKFYNYLSSPPTFEPVFGTDGTTNAVFWNGVMWHPCVTAPPGTNNYTANFVIYLLDTATGAEVDGSSSGPIVFNWTDIPDGRPALILSLTPKVFVTWPATTTTNWVLVGATNLVQASWTPITNMPVTVNDQSSVTLDQNAGQQFFRMRYLR